MAPISTSPRNVAPATKYFSIDLTLVPSSLIPSHSPSLGVESVSI